MSAGAGAGAGTEAEAGTGAGAGAGAALFSYNELLCTVCNFPTGPVGGVAGWVYVRLIPSCLLLNHDCSL